MIALPLQPESPNVAALASLTRETFTGLTTATITLGNEVRMSAGIAGGGLELVFKNGSLLNPGGGASGYSISGKTITLGTAAIAGDWFLVLYFARSK